MVTNARAYYHTTRGCGCNGHPAFPAPSVFRGLRYSTTRAYRAARGRRCICAIVRRVGNAQRAHQHHEMGEHGAARLCPPYYLFSSSPAKAGDPVCAPGMGIDLEVEVLPRAGHSERREAQSVGPRGRREGSVERSYGPTNRNRIQGGAGQGERAYGREALVTKVRQRKSGGRAAKVDVLTRGDLASRLKGRRGSQELRSEKSAEAVVAA